MRTDKSPLEQMTWQAACGFGEFTCAQLAEKAGVGIETARTWVNRWKRQGLVRETARDGNLRSYSTTVAPVCVSQPARQTPQGNMWRAMRFLKGAFTAIDIAAHATTDSVSVSVKEVEDYCAVLIRAGYLRVVRQPRPPAVLAAYQMVNNTGPKPPRAKRVRAVWDANLGEYTHLPGGAQ